MTDRELLELAAKAAGLVVDRKWQAQRDAICDHSKASLWIFDGSTAWNPLKDDGDALRLAVKLRIYFSIHLQGYSSAVTAQSIVDSYTELCGCDEMAATRRAIVRAAAEIGRAMQSDQR